MINIFIIIILYLNINLCICNYFYKKINKRIPYKDVSFFIQRDDLYSWMLLGIFRLFIFKKLLNEKEHYYITEKIKFLDKLKVEPYIRQQKFLKEKLLMLDRKNKIKKIL